LPFENLFGDLPEEDTMPDKLKIDRLNRWLTLGANLGVVGWCTSSRRSGRRRAAADSAAL